MEATWTEMYIDSCDSVGDGCSRKMDGYIKYFPIGAVLFFLFLGNNLTAQNPIISGDSLVFVEKTIKKINKNINFTVLPGPSYNSTQKLGFMVLPVIVYNLHKKDKLSPPSSTALAIYFDFSASWMVAARQNFFWNRNKWRASADCGYGHLRLKFFGIGRDEEIINNNDSSYVWINLDGFNATTTCYLKIVSHLYGGLEYNYANTTLQGSDSASSEKLIKNGINAGHQTESILVPSFVWDNRDNVFWSARGFYAGLNFQLANSVFFSSYDYGTLLGFVNGYHKLFNKSDHLTLAWHFSFQSGWGTLPYSRMAMFGRGDNATGYTWGKYVNNSEVSAQAELRYDLWKFIGVGGYVGAGKVFRTFNAFGPSVWLHFGGARFYVNVMPSRNLRVRLDIAVGRKDYGIYVGLGQGF